MKLRLPASLLLWSIGLILLLCTLVGVYILAQSTDLLNNPLILFGAVLLLFLVGVNIYQLMHTHALAKIIAAAMTDDISQSTELFEELYRNSPVPYLRIARNGDIVSVNGATLRFFRVEDGRLDKLSVYSLINPTDDTKASLLAAEISRGQYLNEVEVSAQNSDGAWRWALLSCFPYGHHNERLVTLFDITKQKEVDIAKSEFVSLASHQLRTPISAIKWNIELLGGDTIGPLNEAQRAYLNKVERNAQKMQLIINDFLDVSQLEMGTFATKVSRITVSTFLESVYEEFNERIERKQITFNKNYQLGELTIQSDERLLHNAISNLVSNAVKYTPESGTVTLEVVAEDSQIIFTISDSGIGIPTEEQDRLFTKFFRATNAQSDIVEGTGLGLYIVAQAVDKLAGVISVTSEVGQGTSFTVTIPRTLE